MNSNLKMTSLINGILIRLLSDSDSLEELTDLLHRAYRVLADMGLRYWATYQSVDDTRTRISRGRCYVAELDAKIVGTVIFVPRACQSKASWMNRDDVAFIEQLAVEPDLQGNGIATMLMQFAEEEARRDGAMELALDTAETATHLIRWYERLGYRFIEYVDWHITNYRSVVLSKRVVSQ